MKAAADLQRRRRLAVRVQQPDGSWARSYRLDGSVAHPGPCNRTNPLAFLIKWHLATNDRKYLDAALKGGAYCLIAIDQGCHYVGRTPCRRLR